MKRLAKSKKAFTLLEIIMVVAIIVILAGTISLSVSQIVGSARNASDELAGSQQDISEGFVASEAHFAAMGF